MDRLEVARFSSLPEAEMAAALLQRHGIDARVPDRDTATVVAHMQLALGGLRVTAPADQITEARQLIDQVRRGEFSRVVDEEEAALMAGQGMAPDEDLSAGDHRGLLIRLAPGVRAVAGGILVLVAIAWFSQLLGWL